MTRHDVTVLQKNDRLHFGNGTPGMFGVTATRRVEVTAFGDVVVFHVGVDGWTPTEEHAEMWLVLRQFKGEDSLHLRV